MEFHSEIWNIHECNLRNSMRKTWNIPLFFHKENKRPKEHKIPKYLGLFFNHYEPLIGLPADKARIMQNINKIYSLI